MSLTFSISVAMATYNGANYIAAQLTSIIEQQLPPTEIVICDDGSMDNTVELVNGFIAKYPGLIRFYQNPERLGFIANFERAISLCVGDVIVLSDQDDLWLPTKLATMLSALESVHTAALVVANAEVVDSELRPSNQLLYSHGHLRLFAEKSTESTAERGMIINGCTLAFRASFRPFIMPISVQEWGHDHWIATLLSLFAPIAIVAEPQMLYRRHASSAGQNPRLERNSLTRMKKYLALKLRHTSIEAYTVDVKQWQELDRRLTAMSQTPELTINPKLLAEAIRIVRRRRDFKEVRLRMRRRHQLLRLPQLSYYLVLGRYHQDANGFGAFLKDLLI